MEDGKIKNEALPPPSVYTPAYCANTNLAVPEFLSGCIDRYIYVFLFSGDAFWLCPQSLNGDTLAGYRWKNGVWESTTLLWRSIDNYY